jgi:hypothetical protein
MKLLPDAIAILSLAITENTDARLSDFKDNDKGLDDWVCDPCYLYGPR